VRPQRQTENNKHDGHRSNAERSNLGGKVDRKNEEGYIFFYFGSEQYIEQGGNQKIRSSNQTMQRWRQQKRGRLVSSNGFSLSSESLSIFLKKEKQKRQSLIYNVGCVCKKCEK